VRLAEDKFGFSWQIVPTALGKLMAIKTQESESRHAGAAPDEKLDIARWRGGKEGPVSR